MKQRNNLFFIIVAGMLVYSNALVNSFVWDDVFIVVHNDFIKGCLLLKEIFLKPLFYFAGSEFLYYRPFQSFTNMCDYYLWGLNPLGFHLTNVFLHIACAVLLYFLLTVLCKDSALSFIATLFFVVHPLNTSVVNYVTSRADILMTIFTLLSLIFFLKAKNYTTYVASCACFVCALLSKEVAVVLPVCLIVIHEMYLQMNERRARVDVVKARFWYLVFLSIPVLYILFRTKMVGLQSSIMPLHNVGFLTIVCTWLEILAAYVRLIFFPSGLHMLRVIDIGQVTSLRFGACVLALIAFVFLMHQAYKRNKLIFTGISLFLIWSAPVASLAFRNPEYYFQQKAMMEEHWLYLPAIGVFVLVASFLLRVLRYCKGRYRAIVLVPVITCLSLVTLNENRYWKDNNTLFTHTLRYVTYSVTVYRNLGWVYLHRGEFRTAIDMYQKALTVKQGDAQKKVLYNAIAYAYFLDGQLDKALDSCSRALRADFKYADGHAYLGLIYSKSDLPLAIQEWKIALDEDRFNNTAFNNLLGLSREDGRIRNYLIEKYRNSFDEYAHFERYKVYSALGLIYLYGGRNEKALWYLQKAVRINPYDSTINKGLAVSYANSQDHDKAIAYFKRVIKLNPFDKEAYKNLSLLYSQLHRDKEATALLEKADMMNMYQ